MTGRGNILITAIIITLFCGCTQKQNSEIVGTREAYKIDICNKSNGIDESLIIKDYGFANINVEPDSAVELNLSILKDVKVCEQVLGADHEITLIKAKYSSMRRGKIAKNNTSGDSLYIFKSGRDKTAPVKLYFAEEGNLVAEFTDSDSTIYKLYF